MTAIFDCATKIHKNKKKIKKLLHSNSIVMFRNLIFKIQVKSALGKLLLRKKKQ